MILDRLLSDAGPVVSRREFLRVGATLGGGLMIGIGYTTSTDAIASAELTAFSPNAFVSIEPDGQVTVTVAYVEMGQGTYTSIPMLIAEELEIDLPSVRVEHAPASDKLYANPMFGFQSTGNSNAIRGAYEPMRRAGAVARTLLIQAAANRWSVASESCYAARGEVIHRDSKRKLSYGALVADAAKLPPPANVKLKPKAEFRLIGTPAKRLDLPMKVNGSAKYGIDVVVPGMKVATLAQSPVTGGKLRNANDAKALAVRGVRQIVRLEDCVAVVADHMGAALKGLTALAIEWDDGPNGKVDTTQIVKSMREASQGRAAVARSEGDFRAALAGATIRLEATYELPFLIHACMEPLNCTVHVRSDSCEVWLGSQVLTRAQAAAAAVTGLPLEKVIVHNHLLGGGFGRRLEFDSVTRAVQIARHVDGPVKVIWTREEDVQHDMYRPYFFDRVSAGLDAQGRPVAWHHRITGSSIIKRFAPPYYKDDWDPETVDGAAQPPYALPNILVDYVNHEPPIPTAFWRGVGPTHNIFVVESCIDELAAAAKQDPVTFRAALLDHNPRAKAVLLLAAQKAGWGRKLPSAHGRGISLQYAFGTYMALVAEVQIAKDRTVAVKRVVCAVDPGIVVNPNTVEAQVQSAVIFGISGVLFGQATLKDGRIEQSNFHDVRVIRMSEAPVIETHIVSSSESPGGIGEAGTSALAPAVTNAIFAATGRRIRKLPVSANDLSKP